MKLRLIDVINTHIKVRAQILRKIQGFLEKCNSVVYRPQRKKDRH